MILPHCLRRKARGLGVGRQGTRGKLGHGSARQNAGSEAVSSKAQLSGPLCSYSHSARACEQFWI